jgi:hypothetical protein
VGSVSRHLDLPAEIHSAGKPPATRPGTGKISLTTERSIAEYFACNAVFGDRHDHPKEESNPIVLVLDGECLVGLLYDLEGYTGDGEE